MRILYKEQSEIINDKENDEPYLHVIPLDMLVGCRILTKDPTLEDQLNQLGYITNSKRKRKRWNIFIFGCQITKEE